MNYSWTRRIGHTGLRELFNFFVLDRTAFLSTSHRIATKSAKHGARRTNTVLTMQVVFVANSTKSPTAYCKQKSVICNEWKFRDESTIREMQNSRSSISFRTLLPSNERRSIKLRYSRLNRKRLELSRSVKVNG